MIRQSIIDIHQDIYEKLQVLAGATSDHARHCAFLLESILEKVGPLTEDEKDDLKKSWTDESEIDFESWELDLDAAVPDLPLDKL